MIEKSKVLHATNLTPTQKNLPIIMLEEETNTKAIQMFLLDFIKEILESPRKQYLINFLINSFMKEGFGPKKFLMVPSPTQFSSVHRNVYHIPFFYLRQSKCSHNDIFPFMYQISLLCIMQIDQFVLTRISPRKWYEV